MKKTTAKDKNNKVKIIDTAVEPIVELEEANAEEVHETAELEPDVLKALIKPKKNKVIIDTTDYVPELERGDLDEGFGPEPGRY
jgi:hypothetical protein